MKKKFSLFILVLLLFINSVNSEVLDNEERYFGDFLIEVSPMGTINIIGDSNYDSLSNVIGSEDFTYKNKDLWILNITTNENFEYYVYEIRMPKGTEIVNLNDRSRAKIFNRDKLIILGDGKDEKVDIYVEYRIDYAQAYENTIFTIGYVIGILLSLLIVFYLIVLFKKNKNLSKIKSNENNLEFPETKNSENIEDSTNINVLNLNESVKIKTNENKFTKKLNFDVSIYPKRQQDIINILLSKNKISQRELEIMMEIPSSSISRNVKSLISKKIVIKERIGHTNYLSISEEVILK